jgi:hypothetical protein
MLINWLKVEFNRLPKICAWLFDQGSSKLPDLKFVARVDEHRALNRSLWARESDAWPEG